MVTGRVGQGAWACAPRSAGTARVAASSDAAMQRGHGVASWGVGRSMTRLRKASTVDGRAGRDGAGGFAFLHQRGTGEGCAGGERIAVDHGAILPAMVFEQCTARAARRGAALDDVGTLHVDVAAGCGGGEAPGQRLDRQFVERAAEAFAVGGEEGFADRRQVGGSRRERGQRHGDFEALADVAHVGGGAEHDGRRDRRRRRSAARALPPPSPRRARRPSAQSMRSIRPTRERTRSVAGGATRKPSAEATPAPSGTTTRCIFSSRARSQACTGPAPPKAISV